jgi:dihydrofolate synthase/folylpolyglutamate synthase
MLIDWLLNIPSKKIKYGLGRTEQFLLECGFLNKSFFKIQILGTNGKGSVAAFLMKALDDRGYKVGMYTSPHLVKVNERVRINNQLIQDKEIEDFLSQYQNKIKSLDLSFFEIMTVMSVWYFNIKNVDIAILETGLGGRLDSVTACEANMLLFTSISMDHHEILGNSIKKIAYEKSSAIQNAQQSLISIDQTIEIKSILSQRAKTKKNKIKILRALDYNSFDLKYLRGKHQVGNANLAYSALQLLNKKNITKINKKSIGESFYNTRWDGRFQVIIKKPLIIYDVAHNKESLKSFLKTFISYIKNKTYKTKYLLCAFEKNKKIKTSIKQYERYFDYIICTETNIRKSMSANHLSQIFNNTKTKETKSIQRAINYIEENANKEDLVVIIGSHFIAPFIHEKFKNCFVHNK